MSLKLLTFKSLSLLAICCLFAFTSQQMHNTVDAPPVKIKLTTNYGVMLLQLYDETPLHRDNFIKLVQENELDSVLFHRVIKHFMIQAGEKKSNPSKPDDTLSDSRFPKSIPSEINTSLFHKKGVLAAARSDTPERGSSSTQFYIVQGKVLNDSLLDLAETRINGWLAEYYIKHDPLYKVQLDSLNAALVMNDWESFQRINDQFRQLAKEYKLFDPYQLPEAHRAVYKSIGGTPHLDQNYTVFGEVISGMDVIDAIAAVATNKQDRPVKDIYILKAEIMEE